MVLQKYTSLKKKDWKIGNKLIPYNAGKGHGHHWWLYEMIEFPVEKYFPENILKRLLVHLPLEEWFPLRRNWTTTFDSFMPANIKVTLKNGREGTIKRLVRNNIEIIYKTKTLTIPPSEVAQVGEVA